ncbi:MAG: hypothetical protein JJE21_08865, partial [Spirochaetaceae bacterium]|nr:hypothetical protein [Spirochaetaceae bacterium]
MKKRFLALVAIAALVMAPTFADVLDSAKTSMENVQSKIMDNTTHPKWSAGLSLGTNSGIQVNYRANNDLTMETIVGFGVPTPDLNVECYGMYKVSDFQINDARFNVNAGLGVSVGYDFDSQFNVTPLVAGEITY